MFRVLVGYGVVSFAVLQIIEPIMHGGFPVAVVLAWAFDINSIRPWLARARAARSPAGSAASGSAAPLRRAPEFAEFARKIGFADLWERYGPPDSCRRVAPRDYACD